MSGEEVKRWGWAAAAQGCLSAAFLVTQHVFGRVLNPTFEMFVIHLPTATSIAIFLLLMIREMKRQASRTGTRQDSKDMSAVQPLEARSSVE